MGTKVGILTFQNANNYGALLQAFALQETVKKLGGNPSIINYDAPLMQLKKLQLPPFERFCKEYLSLTDSVDTGADIDKLKFDTIIVGSDQVWNPLLTGNDMTYFLDFAGKDTVKASYAASIGLNSNYLKDIESTFERYIPEFDYISLREADHVPFVSQFASDGTGAVASIDPSLLLSAEEYSKKLMLSETTEEYIFFFSYSMDSRQIDFVNLLSHYTGYRIVAVTRYPACFFTSKAKIQDEIYPTAWLDILKNSKMVVTDSFHGLMLSIVFGKPFYAHTPDRNNVVRIMNVLKLFGLEKRRLTAVDNISDVRFDINYDYTYKVLAEEREKSFEYLKSFI